MERHREDQNRGSKKSLDKRMKMWYNKGGKKPLN
nr:MAG TPA: hypothetical protein [Caudoviricetes sp.]